MAQYAEKSDLVRLGIPKSAIVDIPDADVDQSLAAASELADSYFRSRYQLPLIAWGDDVRRAVCMIAAYDLLSVRGFNPQGGADLNMKMRNDQSLKWLEQVSSQVVHANVTPTQDEAAGYDQPFVTTGAMRGF